MPRLEFIRLSEGNIPEMIEVMYRSRRGLPHERRLTQEEAKGLTLLDPDFDPEGTWLVRHGAKPIGFAFALVDCRAGVDSMQEGYIDVDVVPECRGKGVEQRLLRESESYLLGRSVQRLVSRCPVVDEWRASLLASNSFREYYRVYLLVRKGSGSVSEPKLPDGFTLERKLLVEFSDSEIPPVVQAFNESFVDHPRFHREVPERFSVWRDTSPDPAVIATVKKDGTIVGLCISEESVSFNKERGVRSGWINVLGVKPQFRRLGLGRALISDGIRWLTQRGMDTVNIGLVAENERAMNLYSSLGFQREQESVWYQKTVGDRPG